MAHDNCGVGLSIKNPEVEHLARELARRRVISITGTIRQGLEREVRRAELRPEGAAMSREIL